MKYFALLFLTIAYSLPRVFSQASFQSPDTVCVNQPVNITNTSTGASGYYWNFCVADVANNPPQAVNLGNPNGVLNVPVFMDYVQVNNNYYGFTVNLNTNRLVRLDFGNSLLNIPVAINLGDFGGIIPLNAEGIQLVFNEGKWYAIIVGGAQSISTSPRIVKVDFGANITNLAPVATNWGNIGGLTYPVDLHVFKENNNWYGFTVNAEDNTITKFNFGTSFDQPPTGINLGNIGNLNYPVGIYAINHNGDWHVFITNAGTGISNSTNSSLTRLDFGNSLLNIPTGTNLGSLNGTLRSARDLYILDFCDQLIGFITNNSAQNDIVRVNFKNNITNIPQSVSLGNIGNLNFPHSISRLFRVGPDLYGFVTNAVNNTITRLKFAGCNNSSIPNATIKSPQPIIYNTAGTYNINLTINDGLPDQSSFCKNVVVMPELPHSSTKNLSVCAGDSILLTSNFPSRNNWNTGNTNNSIYVRSDGLYWVETSNGACTNRDTFIVIVKPAPFQVNLGGDTLICSSNNLLLNANNPGATYLWSTGATTQSINVSTSGKYYVTVTANSCSTSDTIEVAVDKINLDFQYSNDVCNPYQVRFSAMGNNAGNTLWDFGDGASATNSLAVSHLYASSGSHNITYTVFGTRCNSSVSKSITIGPQPDDIVLTQDTTICYGTNKQLRATSALSYCWSPALYLDDPAAQNPKTSTPTSIKYFLTAEVVGNNLIINGDFSNGNTGFTSQYNYASTNVTEAQYFIGKNPSSWNSLLSSCTDHTDSKGNMMLVNGSPTPDAEIWRQTISIQPNTNYAFSTWIQSVFPDNPALLQFSINGSNIGQTIKASLPTCNWTQFYTTWNSGNSSSATISIVNKNTLTWGNDFALDDISFAPVSVKKDSVIITVENPGVKANNDTSLCEGKELQLFATGASSYSWLPSKGLNNTNISNPLASPMVSTDYIVSGITINGCIAKDTVSLTIFSKPAITTSNDTIICKNSSVQLFASGGLSYNWSPSSGLNNSFIQNPSASPLTNTTYYVSTVGANSCTNTDSVKVEIWPEPVYSITPSKSICLSDSIQLQAMGGNKYDWQPNIFLTNSAVPNPKAAPQSTTTYTVLVSDNCDNSRTLSTTIAVKELPRVQISKSNDIDCITTQAQLHATGGIRYNWQSTANINYTNTPDLIISPQEDTWYYVIVTGTNGCTAKDSVLVSTSFEAGAGNFYIPNAFTPNGDGKNDCFGLRHWGKVELFELSIFNRWGELVFFSKNSADCWDGYFRGRSQPSGTYIYQVSVKSPCTKGMLRKKGFVTLIQ